MRKLAILTFITLDGVMQAPKSPEEDTSNNFEQGGWADKYWDEAMALVAQHAMNEPYDVLLGRKTYDGFSAFFTQTEYVDSPLTNLTKYVVTSSLSKLDWKNSIAVSGNIPDEIVRLKEQDGPLLQVHGSRQLITALLKNDLVDELRLLTFPVVVGRGARLFSDGNFPNDLKLVKSEVTPNGVIMSYYERI